MPRFQPVRGMRDLLPEDTAKKKYVVDVIRKLFHLYGYQEVETPTLESFDLVSAKVGDEIRRRMYVFKDLGGRRVALRPEMTAPIARLMATKLRKSPKPVRLAYIANCFRYDNPQLGRYREFWQAGFELMGSKHPEADTEMLMISDDLMKRLGFRDHYFKIGQVGILRGLLGEEGIDDKNQSAVMELIDKGRRVEAVDFLSGLKVSKRCLEAVKNLFQLEGGVESVLRRGRRILADYPSSIQALENLDDILQMFTSQVKAKMKVELSFARGLEYYTGMIFEVYVPELNIALGGGGRYDNLIKLLGGEDLPAVGCSPGIDRVVLAMSRRGLFPKFEGKAVLISAVVPELTSEALSLAAHLRKRDIPAELEVLRGGVKKALSYADTRGFSFVVLVAPKELKRGRVVVKDMAKGTQEEVQLEGLVEKMEKCLG